MRAEQDQIQVDSFIESITNGELAEVVGGSQGGSWTAFTERGMESAPGVQGQGDASEKR